MLIKGKFPGLKIVFSNLKTSKFYNHEIKLDLDPICQLASEHHLLIIWITVVTPNWTRNTDFIKIAVSIMLNLRFKLDSAFRKLIGSEQTVPGCHSMWIQFLILFAQEIQIKVPIAAHPNTLPSFQIPDS